MKNVKKGDPVAPRVLRPELVLRIGIIGQRKLTTSGKLEAAIAQVFDELGVILARVRAGTDRYLEAAPALRVISALADGADQIAAMAALEARQRSSGRAGLRLELHCIFPFAREIYLRNIDNRESFETLCAAAESFLILDGIYDVGADAPPGEEYRAKRRRQKAYRAVAWFTQQQSDILLALWDPSQEGRAGGTEETLREALQAGRMVIWIDPAAGTSVRVVASESDLSMPPMAAAEWRAALSNELRHLLMPPDEHDSLDEIFAGGRTSKTVRQALWNGAMRLAEPRSKADAKPAAATSQAIDFFEAYRERAAELGRYYAGLYRGAFLLNYALGFVAILLAGLAHALHDTVQSEWLGTSLGALELLAVSFILWNTHRAHLDHWHERSIDYRFLAELFRTMTYLAPLGCSPPQTHVWMQYAGLNPQQTWMYWLYRSIVRQAPAVLPGFALAREVRFDKPYCDDCLRRVTEDWLPTQQCHHEHTAAVMGRVFDFVEHAGRILFFVTMFAIAAHVGLEVSHFAPHEMLHGWEREGPEPWLALLATVLPAAVLAANGFRFQAECRRSHERSASMVRQLAKALEAFKPLERESAEGSRSWEIARKTVALAGNMVDEVADWRIVHRMHEVSTA